MSVIAPVAITSGTVDVIAISWPNAKFGDTFVPIVSGSLVDHNVPSPATPLGWQSQSPLYELYVKPFNATLQQFGAFEPLGFIAPPPIKTVKSEFLIRWRRRGRR